MTQLLDALAALHEAGSVHGHLTTESVLLDDDHATLVGFGVRDQRSTPREDLRAWASLYSALRPDAALPCARLSRLAAAGAFADAREALAAVMRASNPTVMVLPVTTQAPPSRRPRWALTVAAVAVVAVTTTAAVVASSGAASSPRTWAPPPVTPWRAWRLPPPHRVFDPRRVPAAAPSSDAAPEPPEPDATAPQATPDPTCPFPTARSPRRMESGTGCCRPSRPGRDVLFPDPARRLARSPSAKSPLSRGHQPTPVARARTGCARADR